MNNRRAQSLNINVIIIVILAILVLLIIVLAFTGGMKTAIDKIKVTLGLSVATSTEEAVEFCNLWCSQESYKTWCDYEFKKIKGASEESPKFCRDIGASCSAAQTEAARKGWACS